MIRIIEKWFSNQPFHGNAAGEVNGAAEEDVVEGKDELGKEDAIDIAVLTDWPRKYLENALEYSEIVLFIQAYL